MGKHTKAPKLVYFARRADGTGPIKIGCSAWPVNRMKQVSCDVKARVVVLASAAGGYREERRLHRQFAALRVESEWFEATPELLAAVDYAARHRKLPPTPASDRNVVLSARYLNGETLQEIATDFGLTRERVRQILRAQGVPSLGMRDQHKRKPDLSDPEQARVVAAYASGMHPKEIVTAFALKGYYALRIILERHGVERHGAGFWLTRDDDKERTEKVAALYRSGLGPTEILKHIPSLKVVPTVYRYLQKAGIAPNIRAGYRRGALEARASEIIAAYHGGLTMEGTAKRFGASMQAISNLIERHGARLPREEIERRRIASVRRANAERARHPQSLAA